MRRIYKIKVNDLDNISNTEKLKIHYINDFYSLILNWKRNVLKSVLLVALAFLLQYVILRIPNSAYARTFIIVVAVLSLRSFFDKLDVYFRKEPFNVRVFQKKKDT